MPLHNQTIRLHDQRQREFRQRNPGYYGRLHAKRRAAQMALAYTAIAPAQTAEPLALPAPAEPLLIPGQNAIPTMAELQHHRAALAIERAA